MISLLTGNILKKFDKFVILNVNDVGYKIYVSDKTINKIDFNEKVSLLCDLQIKDDCINLTGFFDEEEQDAFRLLNSIQGVGTKAALSILSSLTPNELVNAILDECKQTECDCTTKERPYRNYYRGRKYCSCQRRSQSPNSPQTNQTSRQTSRPCHRLRHSCACRKPRLRQTRPQKRSPKHVCLLQKLYN